MRSVKSILMMGLLMSAAMAAFGQSSGYFPGYYQSANPYYPHPNPFYFEGKVTWEYLGITNPSNTWDYMQRAIHKQDDLGDITGAIADYQTSYSMNNVANGTCQYVTAATLVGGKLPSTLTPPPCMFTVRLRLGYLLRQTAPDTAIKLFQEVLQIDPLRLGVKQLIGETWVIKAQQATDPTIQQTDYQNAIAAFQAELALSPVTSTSIALTADQANNAHVHWALAEVYETLGLSAAEKTELQNYLLATQWHSDTYPWRIALAQAKLKTLSARK